MNDQRQREIHTTRSVQWRARKETKNRRRKKEAEKEEIPEEKEGERKKEDDVRGRR